MSTIEQTLLRLQKSAFRAKFHLSEKDRQYIMDKGMGTIQHHAADFIRTRLAPAIIPNDGQANANAWASGVYCPACLRLLLSQLLKQVVSCPDRA